MEEQNQSPRAEAETLFTGTTIAQLYQKYNVNNAQDLMLAIIWRQLFNNTYTTEGDHDNKVLLCLLDLSFGMALAAAFEP